MLVVMICATAVAAPAKRKVIIDQDAFGPAGSNLQAILLLLQADDVDVLGITVTSGDGWRDEEVTTRCDSSRSQSAPTFLCIPARSCRC